MYQHRIWVAATVAWLFFLFNLERVASEINIASFVYAQVTVTALVVLLSNWVRQQSLASLSFGSLVIFLIAKPALGYEVLNGNTSLTMIEAAVLVLSLALVLRVGRDTDAFAESTLQLATMHLPTKKLTSPAIHADMEREIRRARRHDRPLSLMSICPAEGALTEDLKNFFRRIETDLADRYAQGRLAQLLLQETKSADLVGYQDETLVLLLPETDREQAVLLAERLRDRCSEVLGFDLSIGLAAFPGEELTLFGLVDRATSNGTSPAHADLHAELPAADRIEEVV